MLNRTISKQNGVYVLNVDGKPAECPWKAGAPAQDGLGRVQFINQACTSQCAMFNMYEAKDKSRYFSPICSHGAVPVEMEKETQNPIIPLKP